MSPQRGQNVLHVANIGDILYPESKIGFFVQKLNIIIIIFIIYLTQKQ